MDKTKFGKMAWGICILHVVLSLIVMFCTNSNNRSTIQFGFNLGGYVMILYPIVGGIIYIVVSIIGMIKNKKLFPYLICPIISFIVWVILGGCLAVYI